MKEENQLQTQEEQRKSITEEYGRKIGRFINALSLAGVISIVSMVGTFVYSSRNLQKEPDDPSYRTNAVKVVGIAMGVIGLIYGLASAVHDISDAKHKVKKIKQRAS